MTEDKKTTEDPMATDIPFGVSDPAVEEEFDKYLLSVDSDEEEVGVEDEEAAGVVKEEPQEETTEADTAEEETEEQPEPEEAVDGDLETALAAIRRDGLPQAVIDKMTNEEILALGAKRAKVQGDADNAYRELSELKKQQETAPESETESAAIAEPTDQPVSADLQQAIQPFAEIFGEDAADALRNFGEASMEPLRQAVMAQNQMLEGVLMESSRQSLSDQYPSMTNDEAFVRVGERMQSLVKSGEYSDVTSLMSDAARLEFADESAAVSNELKSKLARDKAGGQVMPTGKAETPETSMGEEERENALLDALEGGMEVGEAGRLFGAAQPSV